MLSQKEMNVTATRVPLLQAREGFESDLLRYSTHLDESQRKKNGFL
jgi:hypothetical protein